MGKVKRKIDIDVYIGIILILFSAYLLYESYSIKVESAKFPRIVIILLLILSVVVLFLGIRKTLNPKLKLKSDPYLSIDIIQNPIMVFVLIVAYIVLIKSIGFFISTIIFVPSMMIYYGMRNIKVIILTNIILNLFIYVLFVKMLNVILP